MTLRRRVSDACRYCGPLFLFFWRYSFFFRPDFALPNVVPGILYCGSQGCEVLTASFTTHILPGCLTPVDFLISSEIRSVSGRPSLGGLPCTLLDEDQAKPLQRRSARERRDFFFLIPYCRSVDTDATSAEGNDNRYRRLKRYHVSSFFAVDSFLLSYSVPHSPPCHPC